MTVLQEYLLGEQQLPEHYDDAEQVENQTMNF
jgi:hypothetical protein